MRSLVFLICICFCSLLDAQIIVTSTDNFIKALQQGGKIHLDCAIDVLIIKQPLIISKSVEIVGCPEMKTRIAFNFKNPKRQIFEIKGAQNIILSNISVVNSGLISIKDNGNHLSITNCTVINEDTVITAKNLTTAIKNTIPKQSELNKQSCIEDKKAFRTSSTCTSYNVENEYLDGQHQFSEINITNCIFRNVRPVFLDGLVTSNSLNFTNNTVYNAINYVVRSFKNIKYANSCGNCNGCSKCADCKTHKLSSYYLDLQCKVNFINNKIYGINGSLSAGNYANALMVSAKEKITFSNNFIADVEGKNGNFIYWRAGDLDFTSNSCYNLRSSKRGIEDKGVASKYKINISNNLFDQTGTNFKTSGGAIYIRSASNVSVMSNIFLNPKKFCLWIHSSTLCPPDKILFKYNLVKNFNSGYNDGPSSKRSAIVNSSGLKYNVINSKIIDYSNLEISCNKIINTTSPLFSTRLPENQSINKLKITNNVVCGADNTAQILLKNKGNISELTVENNSHFVNSNKTVNLLIDDYNNNKRSVTKNNVLLSDSPACVLSSDCKEIKDFNPCVTPSFSIVNNKLIVKLDSAIEDYSYNIYLKGYEIKYLNSNNLSCMFFNSSSVQSCIIITVYDNECNLICSSQKCID